MKRRTLLLVDDDPDVLGMFGRAFEARRVRVLRARGAGEALRLAEEECPDLALVDVVLDGESGLELVPRLGRLGVRTVVYSGHFTDERWRQAFESGCLTAYSKSEWAQLVRRILALLPVARRLGAVRVPQEWKLTPREHEVVLVWCAGKDPAALGLAKATVRSHRSSIFAKSGLRSETAVVAHLLGSAQRLAFRDASSVPPRRSRGSSPG